MKLAHIATLPRGLQLELMAAPWVEGGAPQDRLGWAQVALSLESVDAVDAAAARIGAVRQMIMAGDEAGRRVALEKLMPFQRDDFISLFRI
uniref:hypothetical protein n=1 Tax=Acidisoma sp. L85 TaxID=1641850 RepID=UPI00131B4324